uniref:Centromere protein S n=1 Tax=Peronospora matthiolae TaxID=2874970 RepID=A0AAV1UIK6_9STRA
MNPSSGLESEELHLRQSILYTVGRICDDEAKKKPHEHHTRIKPAMSKEAMALLADVVYKQAEVMATELQFFARHANRKVIKPEDVLLCARKQSNLTNLLHKYQREHLNTSSATSAGPKKRRGHVVGSD